MESKERAWKKNKGIFGPEEASKITCKFIVDDSEDGIAQGRKLMTRHPAPQLACRSLYTSRLFSAQE